MDEEKFDKEKWLFNITCYREKEIKQLDDEVLTRLLKHPDWEQQQYAALELQARTNARAYEVIMDLSQIDETEQVKLSLARLQELRIGIEVTSQYYKLFVPHSLSAVEHIELGYLMAQLAELPFPQNYAPISARTSQAFSSGNQSLSVEFRESYPSYMKFFVYRLNKPSKPAQFMP